MLIDAIDPQTETGSIGSDSDDPQTEIGSIGSDSNPQLNSMPVSAMEDSDEEYETWEGFSSGAYLSLQLIGASLHRGSYLAVQTSEVSDTESAPKNLSKRETSAKPTVRNASAGKMAEKRKAPRIADKYVAHHLRIMCRHQCDITVPVRPRKRMAPGTGQKVDKSPDMDEVTSRPGGFADDEDIYSIVADREEVVNLTKSSRRSAMVCTIATALRFPHSCILFLGRSFCHSQYSTSETEGS